MISIETKIINYQCLQMRLPPPFTEAAGLITADGKAHTHPGGDPGANFKTISKRCYFFEVAFVWELTKETIVLPLGCLQRGLHLTSNTLHLATHNQIPATSILHPTPYTLHPAPCTLHPAPCTLHPAPCTLHPPTWSLKRLHVCTAQVLDALRGLCASSDVFTRKKQRPRRVPRS